MQKITIIHSSQIRYANLYVLVWYPLDDVQVPPWWLVVMPRAWSAIVDLWFAPDWEAKHLERRERRLKMEGPPHHQGPLNMSPPAPQTQWGMPRGPWGMPRGPSTGHACRRQLSRLRGGCRVARPLGLGCHNSHRGLGWGRGHNISHRSEFLDLATFICISTAKLACAM
jgi:hypothetical protein